MVIVKIGKANKRYHKDRCYKLYEEDIVSKEREREALNSLVETIKELHNMKIIPNQFYPYLQDLRNGNELFGKVGYRKSKDGYTYQTIEKTYEYCKDKIDWAMKNIDADSFGLLKYTRAIIVRNITKVASMESRKEHFEEVTKATEDRTINMQDHLERKPIKYKKKKSKNDISSILD